MTKGSTSVFKAPTTKRWRRLRPIAVGAQTLYAPPYTQRVVYFRELETCFAGLCWISDAAGVSDQKDWVSITPEELTPIVRDAIGSIPEQANCQCQYTWVGSEDRLPSWYLAMR